MRFANKVKAMIPSWRILVVLTLAVAASGACGKKEAPGPAPEPTPAPTIVVVEPTVSPWGDVVCFVPVPRGTPPYCKGSRGQQVTCPVDMAGLPECGN